MLRRGAQPISLSPASWAARSPSFEPNMESTTLFGYQLPFPRQDLYVALIAVASFIPAVVLVNALVHGLLNIGGLIVGKSTKRA